MCWAWEDTLVSVADCRSAWTVCRRASAGRPV